MEDAQSSRLHYGGKITWFDSHRMFLDQNHPFRKDRKNFLKGHTVTRSSPPVRMGQEILTQICELGIRKVTELDAEEVNKRLCKSCGWKKRSIFWDLPYWSSNMIRHNLDVMHIEKNVFDNVFNTVLNVDGKAKDNPKACQEVTKYYNRPELARNPDGSYPKAAYTIDKNKKKVLFDWLEGVKFPDGYLRTLKNMIGNKASVEGSICEAYLMAESTQFFSHYFEPHVMSRHHNVSRNDDGGVMKDDEENLSIFTHPGRLSGEAKKRDLSLEEIKAAQTYILLNCQEVEPFGRYNFKVHRGSARSTMNSGVCISDPNTGDYYGRIQEIIQVEYRRAPLKQVMLLKCEWFDPALNIGVKVHNQYKLVDVNHRRRFKKYEPFILAMQATQVCYLSYPSTKKEKDDWLAVLKVNPRDVIELPDEGVITIPEPNLPFQVEEVEVHEIDTNIIVDETILLHDLNGEAIEMDEPIDYGLFPEHHELDEEFTEDEYETENESEEDDEEFEEEIDTD
ncbi:uncharacterized protein LOC125854565 [Solanum stenotomum]|uniref:uncharacterized protein LOC125854565 n=1 Tax=Solanum stenotomum TaxID=172797 RepID=UPI0020D0AE1E|nr:uncharacterized protein LOC125854565 [Solanum stenotomum]